MELNSKKNNEDVQSSVENNSTLNNDDNVSAVENNRNNSTDHAEDTPLDVKNNTAYPENESKSNNIIVSELKSNQLNQEHVQPDSVQEIIANPEQNIVTDPQIKTNPPELSNTVPIRAKMNSSLDLLATYKSGSDTESDSEPNDESNMEITDSNYRNIEPTIIFSSDSEESSSSSDDNEKNEEEGNSSDNASDDEEDEENIEKRREDGNSEVQIVKMEFEASEKKQSKRPIKAKGELDLNDLPPIEELNISVPENQCVELGKIFSIIDQLVLVESLPRCVALDIETVLFLEHGNKTLGKIFDVLGQINQPMYCIRFNSNSQVREKGIEVGMKVYWVPKSEHTSIVVIPNLMKQKGSDASWENDIEPPESCLDFSDDEQERDIRKAKKASRTIADDPNKRMRTNQNSSRNANQFNNNQMNRMRRRNYNYQQYNSWGNPFTSQPYGPQMNVPAQSSFDTYNYSWHTYYQNQAQSTTTPPNQGPFYVNPYAQMPPMMNQVPPTFIPNVYNQQAPPPPPGC